jgi:hypothetical protein
MAAGVIDRVPLDKGSAVFTSAAAGATAGADETGAAESEAGVDAEAGVNPGPSLTRARADGPIKASNMAATATLTLSPFDVSANARFEQIDND